MANSTHDELDARAAAVNAVSAALAEERFASDLLGKLRTAGRLVGRGSALAREIAQGALRHLLTIEHVLGRVAEFDPRRTSGTLRAVLATAAYQLVWMTGVPAYAAVDQAVTLARRLQHARAGAMANAVLRRLATAIIARGVSWRRLDPTQVRTTWSEACAFAADVLPVAESDRGLLAHVASAAGERGQRLAHLAQRYGLAQAEAVAWASQAIPPIVVHRNPLRITADAFVSELKQSLDEGLAASADTAFVPSSAHVIDTPAFRRGAIFIQDTTAHAAALAVVARPGERVLDLCAAPGGKAVTLAMAMEDRGRVVACDVSRERLARVNENARRLGLTCIEPRVITAGAIELGNEVFDAALVDVPCSNTGVIARRPEARLRFATERLQSLVATQHELLRQAARHVRPGGRLVYSTCSVEPEENEAVVAQFLREDAAWRLDWEQTVLPAWGPSWSDWRDGGYAARLTRTDK